MEKTCVVIGKSHGYTGRVPFEIDVCESAVFGDGFRHDFSSAHAFVKHIQDLHKNNGRELTITAVVIG